MDKNYYFLRSEKSWIAFDQFLLRTGWISIYKVQFIEHYNSLFQVGLRWWNCINEAGDSEWVFEARNGDSQSRLSRGEVRLFWIALVLAPAFWILFFFTALFR
jgi:hypothetical protein